MGFLTLRDGHLSFAEELPVCGDGVRESDEQCDDGNLVNGDTCSNLCMREICGNGIIDADEQCDDGNGESGDGCSEVCSIEFCGNGIVERKLGEQCDDGNGESGDGCSLDCHREAKDDDLVQVDDRQFEEKTDHAIDILHSAPLNTTPTKEARIEQPVRSALSQEAGLLGKELMSQAMEDLLSHLTKEERDTLAKIFSILAKGLRLSSADRREAGVIAETLNTAMIAERTRHTDLLVAFIQSPMSQEFLREIGIDPTKLTGEIPESIQELLLTKERHTPIAIREGVLDDTLSLARLGIPRSTILSEEILQGIQSDKPFDRLAAIKALKDRTEASATTNIDASMETLKLSTKAIKESIPLLVNTHQLTTSQEQELQTALNTLSTMIDEKKVDDVSGEIVKITTMLRRWDVLKKEGPGNHPAAPDIPRLGESSATELATLPENMTMAFSHGSEREQALELVNFLSSNERIRTLRSSLQAKGLMTMEERYRALVVDLQQMGRGATTISMCDDDMPQALQCVSVYMADLEMTVRNQSLFRRVVGSLQDYFGIGNE